ncbi:MAG: response regulator transcription factor, partial [Burkholderiales bacterium]|nr:response regulator transcription factor [Burkholderiales bacterium]
MSTQHILMIEDDQRLASMVATYLAQHGISVVHAENGQQGMAKLLAPDHGFSLVLL